jgi:hypothetical protein
MIGFLIGLMAVVSAFAVVGKPATPPLHTSDDVKVRGSLVSETAKNLDTKTKVNASAEESAEVDGSDSEKDKDSKVKVESATKVSAYNTKSGKVMPALIPQVAVDNSVALDTEADTDVDNSDAEVNSNARLNVEFGQSVATSQPESAKTDGKVFGTATSQAAAGNSNR